MNNTNANTSMYVGNWERADLCASCGEYLGEDVIDKYWGKPCHSCGQLGRHCPDVVTTTRRFVCTKKKLFGSDKGYYEWSGKRIDGVKLDSKYVLGRNLVPVGVPVIAAAGLASGLF